MVLYPDWCKSRRQLSLTEVVDKQEPIGIVDYYSLFSFLVPDSWGEAAVAMAAVTAIVADLLTSDDTCGG